jgi:hypothetical protein
VKHTTRPIIFKWRQTAPELILCAVRWYLRYSLSLRDVEELFAERGLDADHTDVRGGPLSSDPVEWEQERKAGNYRELDGSSLPESLVGRRTKAFVPCAISLSNTLSPNALLAQGKASEGTKRPGGSQRDTESHARGVVAWQESRRGSRLRSSNVLARDAFGILLILRPGPR